MIEDEPNKTLRESDTFSKGKEILLSQLRERPKHFLLSEKALVSEYT